MKFIFSLATLFFLTGSCNSQKEAVTNSNESKAQPSKENLMMTDKQQAVGQNYDVAVIYEVKSRGFAKYAYVSKTKVMLSQDRSLQKIDEYTCDAKDWEEIEQLLDAVERKTFHE